MRSPSGWTSISHTNPWSQHYPEQIYQQNGPQRSLRTLTLSSINIIILLIIIVVIIIINTLIIIIIWSYSSTAAAEEASSSSVPSLLSSYQHLHHYHFYHQNHYRTIFTIIVVVAFVITTVWNKNMLKKRLNICQIRWDTIVIFISRSTKTLQLEKGLNFNMQKITSQSKLYINCNDCGMAQYMYFDY